MKKSERLELIYHYSLQVEADLQRLNALSKMEQPERANLYSTIQSLLSRIRSLAEKGLES